LTGNAQYSSSLWENIALWRQFYYGTSEVNALKIMFNSPRVLFQTMTGIMATTRTKVGKRYWKY
jgi:hypothetical protein